LRQPVEVGIISFIQVHIPDGFDLARSKQSDTSSTRTATTRASTISSQGQGYPAQPQPHPIHGSYRAGETTSSVQPYTLFPKDEPDNLRSSTYPVRESSLKNLYVPHDSNTPQAYNQETERGSDVRGITRLPTRESKTERQSVESDNDYEEDAEYSADSQQESDPKRTQKSQANVAIPRTGMGGLPDRHRPSRIPIPHTEVTSEKSLQVPGDSRPRPNRRDSSAYTRRKESERKSQLTQEGQPKVTQTTTVVYRDVPDQRNPEIAQRKDVYQSRDRYDSEGALSSSFDQRRGDSDPDPDQPSRGGTIGFSQRDLGSRSLQENALSSSPRHHPEVGFVPDPEPDQPNRPYGFRQVDERAQDSRSKLDVRSRTEDRQRATQLELERPSVNRAPGQYYTNQEGITTTSRERRSERATEYSGPRRRSPHHISSGTKKDNKDIYERHKRKDL
jgi:hypothetical protein